MPLIIAGIDEAGYGPTLGPFCVGLSVFETPDEEAPSLPDLWKALKKGVCRVPGRGAAHDRRGRVAVADSKQLKLPNASANAHPLVHLERGVLAFKRLLRRDWSNPCDEADLFTSFGIVAGAPACYATPGACLPRALTPGEVAIAGSILEGAVAGANISVLDFRVDVTWEPEFNQTVRERNNKADAALASLCRHLRRVWLDHAAVTNASGEPCRLHIACDRLGGRIAYADILSAILPNARVEIQEEVPQRSRYTLREPTDPHRCATIEFLVEGESQHLPIALASMGAKYVRELAMARFNAYFSSRCRDLRGHDLKATAGYSADARRWLADAGDILSARERAELVRVL